MEKEINNTNSKFGIEVEFFIVDKDGYPVLNSNDIVKNKCLEVDPNLSIVNELSSFQIEINPGPWPFNSTGLQECLKDLGYHYDTLKKVTKSLNWNLDEGLMPSKISQEIINHPDYFTKSPRFKASSEYFSKRDDIILKNSSCSFTFPGEKIIGCINEIHIHAQLSNDNDTIKLFNYLNFNGLTLTEKFNQEIRLNDKVFKDYNSIELFKLANGEWNKDKTIDRVGILPNPINRPNDYIEILNLFNKIPYNNESFLDLESTVYLWTRLRGEEGNLRVEFRPMEMGNNWIERVKYLYKTIKDFEKFNLDCQAHLQFAQSNAKT